MENKTAIEILEHHKRWLGEPPTYGRCSMIAEAIGVAIDNLKKEKDKYRAFADELRTKLFVCVGDDVDPDDINMDWICELLEKHNLITEELGFWFWFGDEDDDE